MRQEPGSACPLSACSAKSQEATHARFQRAGELDTAQNHDVVAAGRAPNCSRGERSVVGNPASKPAAETAVPAAVDLNGG
jgi:hypothetical protein